MGNKLSDMMITVDAVLDIADVLEDRRKTLEDGQGLGDIDDDPSYQAWQRLYGTLSSDVRVVTDEVRYATIDEAVKTVQAVIEAAHKLGVDRRELIYRARVDGPPSEHPLVTPLTRRPNDGL